MRKRSAMGGMVRKRSFDLLFGGLALVLFLPLGLLLAVLVRLWIGSPVFFCQVRPGLGGQPFTLYKFRTMNDAHDASGRLLPDGQRLLKFGRLLRSTSLDELPEIINVLKGEMSLVGPRPLLMSYLPYLSERESLRHSLRPGITGWAQIHGRNASPWDERLERDVWYVENRSLGLDVKILFKTVGKVFFREGVSPDADAVEPYLDQERREERAKRRGRGGTTSAFVAVVPEREGR